MMAGGERSGRHRPSATEDHVTQERDGDYARWLREVDAEIGRLYLGCSLDDLCDYCYRDAFDDGVSPRVTARRAIRADQYLAEVES